MTTVRLKAVALVAILALGLLAAPVPVEAQKEGKVYRIGILTSFFPVTSIRPAFSGFGGMGWSLRGWLRELGYVQGENMDFEQRSPGPRRRHALPELGR